MRALAFALVLALPWSAHAQAEPAPESYRPPQRSGMPQPQQSNGPTQREEEAKQTKWCISVAPHLNVLVGDPPPGLPRIGYGAGLQVTRALLPIGRGRFGVGVDFGYDRFSHDLKASAFASGTQFVAHATFAAMAVIDGFVGRVRPWLAVGGGFSVANYENPPQAANPMGDSRVGAAGLIKVALGLGVRVYEGFELGLHGEFDVTLSPEMVGDKNVWQPGFFSLGLDLGFRF